MEEKAASAQDGPPRWWILLLTPSNTTSGACLPNYVNTVDAKIIIYFKSINRIEADAEMTNSFSPLKFRLPPCHPSAVTRKIAMLKAVMRKVQ
jgi:hypothetical protein